MRTLLAAMLIITLLVALPTLAQAGISFAVYGEDGPIYGMSLDADGGADFAIRIDAPQGQHRVLSLSFLGDGGSSLNACLSETGMFASMQALYPDETSTNPLCYRDTITVSGAATSFPFLLRDTAQVKALLKTQHIVHAGGSYHVLIADPTDAIVLELITDATRVTECQGDYLLMGNFAIWRPQGEAMRPIDAVGADAYDAAQAHIEACLPAFSVEDALDTLALAAQHDEAPTRLSIVHDAASLTSYLAVGGDFDHIYRISMMEGTAETHKGFGTPSQWTIDEADGLSLATLLEAVSQ